MIGATVLHTPDLADPMARCPDCQGLLRFAGTCTAAPAHGLQRTLDLSAVEVGAWVAWGGAEECEAEGRGGIVIGVDRSVDAETGETYRLFQTVKANAHGARYDALREDKVGTVDPPNPMLIRTSWRQMARVVGRKRGTALPEEMRLIETIYRLKRSVA